MSDVTDADIQAACDEALHSVLPDIDAAIDAGMQNFSIPFNVLDDYDGESGLRLGELFLDSPESVLKGIEAAIREHRKPWEGEISIGVQGGHNKVQLRSIRTDHMGKWISVSGIISRATLWRPELHRAVFQCQRCQSSL